MYFGYGAPTRPPLGTAANTRAIAAKAEEVGLSYVSIADHIFPPFDERDSFAAPLVNGSIRVLFKDCFFVVIPLLIR